MLGSFLLTGTPTLTQPIQGTKSHQYIQLISPEPINCINHTLEPIVCLTTCHDGFRNAIQTAGKCATAYRCSSPCRPSLIKYHRKPHRSRYMTPSSIYILVLGSFHSSGLQHPRLALAVDLADIDVSRNQPRPRTSSQFTRLLFQLRLLDVSVGHRSPSQTHPGSQKRK